MIRHVNLLVVTAIALFFTSSCTSTNTEKPKEQPVPNVVAKANIEGEEYLNYLDFNDSLYKANSLYYSKKINDQVEWTEVIMSLDDSSRILKMIEQIAHAGSDAVFSNHFYFKDGKKYATKQFFVETASDSSYFVELLSYYDKNEKVKVTKRRTAPYEDLLDQEQYMITQNKECSSDRAFRIVNQTGEFKTTYQGFVDMEGFKFLVVGEDKKDGFSSALIVQRTTPLIMELRNNEADMLGTPLIVNFQTITEGGGSEQILIAVARE